MSENKSKDQNSQADNDEDFGLPPVSINPLESTPAATPPVAPAAEKKSVPTKRQIAATTGGQKTSTSEKKKNRSSNWAFVWILLLVLLIGFGAYYWGNWGDFSSDQASEKPIAVEEPVPENPAPPAPAAPEEEVAVAEDPVTEPVLTGIDARGTSARYFLVVGSFIDDDMARDYSAKLNKDGLQTVLINP